MAAGESELGVSLEGDLARIADEQYNEDGGASTDSEEDERRRSSASPATPARRHNRRLHRLAWRARQSIPTPNCQGTLEEEEFHIESGEHAGESLFVRSEAHTDTGHAPTLEVTVEFANGTLRSSCATGDGKLRPGEAASELTFHAVPGSHDSASTWAKALLAAVGSPHKNHTVAWAEVVAFLKVPSAMEGAISIR